MRNGLFSASIIIVTAGLGLAEAPRVSAQAPAARAMAPDHAQAMVGSGEPTARGDENKSAGGRFWFNAEYLLWWIEKGNIPPLATASPADGGGAIGDPGTVILFGDNLDYDARHGGRFTFGMWLDCQHKFGIEGSYFFLDGSPAGFNASSNGADGTFVLTRPFINAIDGSLTFQLVAVPGVIAGDLGISSGSSLQNGELNLLCNQCCRKETCCAAGFRLDVLAGMRYLELNENLTIAENLLFLIDVPEDDPVFLAGSTIRVVDEFTTRNRFYGAQVGARAEWQRGRCFVNVLGKLALGNMHQEVRVTGTTTFTDPGAAPIVQPGGLLAQATNGGRRSRDQFSVVSEIGVNVGCQLTQRWRASAGYSFLYVSSVVRPGDQIDLAVNPNQLPSAAGPGTLDGPARPAPLFQGTDFWAQGMNFGLEYRW